MNNQDTQNISTIDIFKARRDIVSAWLNDNRINAAVFIDDENGRNQAVRYFTNHPTDAILVITNFGTSVLCPWDEILAAKIATAEIVIPYTKYDRDPIKAVKAICKYLKLPENARIEIPPATPYPEFLKYVDALSGYDVLCREKGVAEVVAKCRECKDESEIAAHRKAAEITDCIIDKIEDALKKRKLKTEMDVALFIEKELRLLGAESTSFDTLAAGAERSFGIHCFPSYTSGKFATQGLSILDFGVKYNGYCSDVTLTIACEPLTDAQREQLELVKKAYEVGLKHYQKDLPIKIAALKVNEVFAKAKRKMPHSLGHGTGLDIHEPPFVKPTAKTEKVFKPGMIVTLEPGLYDSVIGGCRFENDILITEKGNEPLTHSRIIYL